MAETNSIMKWILRIEEDHKDMAEIPVVFYHILYNQCGAAKIFRGSDGPAWDIVIRRTKSGNMITGMYVEGGWKEFISDNDIEVGDTLIMYYKGRRVFHTQIFSYDGHDKTHNGILVTQTIVTRRRLPLSVAEMENHLRLMQQQRPEPSSTYIFDVRSIFQGIIVVPTPFATMHFWTADPCTAVLLRHRRDQWCVDLQVNRQEGAMSFYRDLPSCMVFFKDEFVRELELPEGWNSMLAGVHSPVKVIRGSNRRVWNVQLLKVTEQNRQYMCLDFGWEVFVNDNNIHEGECLMIYYGGNRKFYVRIFSSSMVERFGSHEPIQGNFLSAGITNSYANIREYLGIGDRLWFLFVVTPACLQRDYLDIPPMFGNQVFSHVETQTEIQVQHGDRTWDAVVEICYKDNGNIYSRIKEGMLQVFPNGNIVFGKTGGVFLQSSNPIVLEIVLR